MEAIAVRLRATDDHVRWAHLALNLEPVGEIEPVSRPTPVERAAMLERMPKKMRERIQRSRQLGRCTRHTSGSSARLRQTGATPRARLCGRSVECE